jgi:DNA-directed RNA polymerase subunit RPC12/RpoP
MNCQKCGQEINPDLFPPGLTYCPQCGSKIEADDPGEGINFCPYCGRRLMAQAKFCPECGKMLLVEPDVSELPKAQNFSDAGIDQAEENGTAATGADKPLEIKTSLTVFNRLKATFNNRLSQPILDMISGRRNLKQLYRDWATHDALPQEEIPGEEYFKNIRKTAAGGNSVPVWMILVLIAGIILIFIGAGFFIAAYLTG